MSVDFNGNNKRKKALLDRIINETLDRVLRKGFHGTASFSVSIQDGTIQEVEKQEIERHRNG